MRFRGKFETSGFCMLICKAVMQLHTMWTIDSKANRCISTGSCKAEY